MKQTNEWKQHVQDAKNGAEVKEQTKKPEEQDDADEAIQAFIAARDSNPNEC
jgi:hypothetical protein